MTTTIKDIIKKCAQLSNRDDIASAINEANILSEITNTSLKNDIIKLIQYYNFVLENIYENYINIEETDQLISDESNRIYFNSFKYKPIKIIKVTDLNNKNIYCSIHSEYIETNSPYSDFRITYYYTPAPAFELNENLSLPYNLNERVICYGIVSEFLASKDQYDKSEFWKNKFLYEIFKFKVKKERKLKLTF